jgi:hypothetical protein
MSLFAHRFLIDDSGRPAAPGTYDDLLGLRVGPDGGPVAGDSTMAGPTVTHADVDPSPVLGATETRGDVDPDRRGAAVWTLGPIRTASDVDADRRALP